MVRIFNRMERRGMKGKLYWLPNDHNIIHWGKGIHNMDREKVDKQIHTSSHSAREREREWVRDSVYERQTGKEDPKEKKTSKNSFVRDKEK